MSPANSGDSISNGRGRQDSRRARWCERLSMSNVGMSHGKEARRGRQNARILFHILDFCASGSWLPSHGTSQHLTSRLSSRIDIHPCLGNSLASFLKARSV